MHVLWLFELLGLCIGHRKGLQIVYGKYFPDWHTQPGVPKDYGHNSYWLYKPQGAGPVLQKLPVVYQWPGAGWLVGTGPFTESNPSVDSYNNNGIAFISTNYRTADINYSYFDNTGAAQKEEYIHVSPDGKLFLDTTGKQMADYKVQITYEELATKCLYDATTSLEHLIAHADEYGLDIHRIVLLGSSAGSAMMNYLTWLYHKWNTPRFTVKGLILSNPQFNYPVVPPLDLVWNDFAEHLGPTAKISKLFGFDACHDAVADSCNGNFPNDTVPCVDQWNAAIRQRYCQSEAIFNATTIADMMLTHRWNQSLPESAGFMKIWNTRQNMMEHHPQGVSIFVHEFGYPETNPFLHHPLYVQLYGEAADAAGIDYTVVFRVAMGLEHAHNSLHQLKRAQYDTVSNNLQFYTAYQSSNGQPVIQNTDGIQDPGFLYNFMAPDAHLQFVCYVTGLSGCAYNNSAYMRKVSLTQEASKRQAVASPSHVMYYGGGLLVMAIGVVLLFPRATQLGCMAKQRRETYDGPREGADEDIFNGLIEQTPDRMRKFPSHFYL